MKGWNKIKKKNKFPQVPNHRRVAVAVLWTKGLPKVMFGVDKYSKGWMKKYKSYEDAINNSCDIKFWK